MSEDYWDFRVFMETIYVEKENGSEEEVEVYHFGEVHYDDDLNIKEVYFLTDEDPVLMKDSFEGLESEVMLLMDALDKPILLVALYEEEIYGHKESSDT